MSSNASSNVGTTSACAENTRSLPARPWQAGNYLRMRGEYSHEPQHPNSSLELPPHARRILMLRPHALTCRGTTSACAENTVRWQIQHGIWRNYLRVRGEYLMYSSSRSRNLELPPRARRIHRAAVMGGVPAGTTSACAENTLRQKRENDSHWNYLRVRGEYLRLLRDCLAAMELPPRARRIHRNVAGES